MEVILDASAIIAVIADEPEAQIVINCTKNAAIVSPINENENEKTDRSPLEGIPRVKLNVTTQEIVEILQECRAGL